MINMIFKDKKKMEFWGSFVPTSKAQLIQVAVAYSEGNLEKAQEIIDFYTRNMNLPDVEPVTPTFMQQVKASAADIFSWCRENQDTIAQGYEFLRQIIANKGKLPDMGVGTAEPPAAEIPPIN